MSDPVTNADIEDVLSSIRRLVSENASPETADRVQPVPSTQPAQPAPKPDLNPDEAGHTGGETAAPAADFNASDKLVLTPAFRVHEPVLDAQPAPAEEAPSTEQTVQDIASEIAAEAAVAAEPEDEQAESSASDGVMFLHQPINRPEVETEQAAETNAADCAPETPVEQPDEDLADEAPAMDAQPDTQSEAQPHAQQIETQEQVEAATGAVAEEVNEAALDSQTDDANSPVDPAQDTPPAEIEVDVQVAEDFNWPPTAQEVEVASETPDEDPALEHRVAELEAAVNDSAVEFEPDLGDAVEDLGPGIFLRHRAGQDRAGTDETDTTEQGAAEATTQNWEEFDAEVAAFMDDDKEIEGHAEPTQEAGEDQPILEEDADLIDEEMLRELVVRLVREELQGAVGEKITRNVRRLVRREVERALTLKSLE